MTIVFSGHREILLPDIETRLEAAVEKLLQEKDNEFLFLNGGMGQFDGMGASAVRAAKCRYPEKKIMLVLVPPYLSKRLNTDKEYYQQNFDRIIIPEEPDTVHYKAIIERRNRWMIDRADLVIACVCRDFGGAATMLRYAKRQGKPVINLAERR